MFPITLCCVVPHCRCCVLLQFCVCSCSELCFLLAVSSVYFAFGEAVRIQAVYTVWVHVLSPESCNLPDSQDFMTSGTDDVVNMAANSCSFTNPAVTEQHGSLFFPHIRMFRAPHTGFSKSQRSQRMTRTVMIVLPNYNITYSNCHKMSPIRLHRQILHSLHMNCT